MCLLASEMFLHLTSQKLSQNVFPRPNSAKLVPKWWLSLFPTKNIVQEDLIMQVTQPPISAQEFKLIFILNLPQKISKLTLIYPSIHPSNLPQKLYLKLTLSVHLSIHLTYHKNSQTYTNPSIHPISNLHLSTHPPFLYLKFTPSILPSIHLTYH